MPLLTWIPRRTSSLVTPQLPRAQSANTFPYPIVQLSWLFKTEWTTYSLPWPSGTGISLAIPSQRGGCGSVIACLSGVNEALLISTI